MSTVNLKLMACALCGEKDGCTGGAGTHIRPYGPTHRTRAKDHATTPVPSCQPSGIRYALRVSRLIDLLETGSRHSPWIRERKDSANL